jgi:hypothetical protein
MPVPTSISSLSPTAGSNSPVGTENVGPFMNQYIQAAYGFIAQLYQGGMVPTAAVTMNSQQINNLANGVLSTDAANLGQINSAVGNYMPLAGGIFSGAVTFNVGSTFTGASTFNGSPTFNASPVFNAIDAVFKDSSGNQKRARCLTNTFTIANNADTANIFLVDDSGNVAAAGNITGNSDERLKDNWSPLPANFIERLSRIKSGTYDRIDLGERQVGVGAQSLRRLLPEATLKVSGKWSVAYGNAALVSTIELAKEVVAQRKIIKQLERRLAKLERK